MNKYLHKKEFIIIFILSLIFAISLFLNHIFNYQFIKEKFSFYESNQFDKINVNMNEWFGQSFYHLQMIKAFLEKKSFQSIHELNQTINIIQATSSFSFFFLGLNNNTLITTLNDKSILEKNHEFRHQDWFIETFQKNKNIYINLDLKEPVIFICTQIHVGYENGVLCGGYQLESLQKYLSLLAQSFERLIYLIDNNGMIILSINNNSSIKNLNINALQNNFLVLNIKDTDLYLVFEKNDITNNRQFHLQLTSSLFIYLLSFMLYIIINIFWIFKNKQAKYELIKHKNYFNDFMQHHTNRGIIICDQNQKILFCNHAFKKLLDFQNRDDELTLDMLFNFYIQFDPITKIEITNLMKSLDESNNKLEKYFNFKRDNKNLLLTYIPFSYTDNEHNGFLLYLQDTTEIQVIEVDQEVNSYNDVYNIHIEKLLFFIHNNLDDESLDINKLAHVSGYSKYHLQRIFKNYCGENIASYLRRLRMEKSAFFLKYSNDKISSIASMCGFTYSPSYIRSFEKYYNLAPRDFRIYQIAQIHLSMYLNESDYEIVKLKEQSILIIQNQVTENYLLQIKKLLLETYQIDLSNISLISLFENDFDLYLKNDMKNKPQSYGIIFKNNEISKVKNLPIKQFTSGRYAKITFDPQVNNLHLFTQKIYTTFYRKYNYIGLITPIFQEIDSFEQTSPTNSFYIKLPI